MTGKNIDIHIIKLNWIQDFDDPEDYCAHGKVYIKIGNELLTDENDNEGLTLSAAGIHLMRTVITDYNPGDYASQLIPCCGHLMLAADGGKKVNICGCPNGIDWYIQHEGDTIRHITENGEEATISIEAYKKMVLAFANQVEQFYRNSKPKLTPGNKEDREGYQAFWNEWRSLKTKCGKNRYIWKRFQPLFRK